MIKQSKRYRSAREVTDLSQNYSLDEALKLLAQMSSSKFDESVELSVHLGVDPRQSNQMVRGVVNLPCGSGKKVNLVVFTEKPDEALAAGADEAGMDELIKKVQNGWVDFDVAVATPAAMKEVRKVARILGPRGLMPNPKTGTVTDDVESAIKDIKLGGRVSYKMDRTANIGLLVGKRSFTTEQLAENIKVVIENIGQARPEALKGRYIKKMTVSSTMSPGIKLDGSLYSNYYPFFHINSS